MDSYLVFYPAMLSYRYHLNLFINHINNGFAQRKLANIIEHRHIKIMNEGKG